METSLICSIPLSSIFFHSSLLFPRIFIRIFAIFLFPFLLILFKSKESFLPLQFFNSKCLYLFPAPLIAPSHPSCKSIPSKSSLLLYFILKANINIIFCSQNKYCITTKW
uniref:Uncharacterized protein n=1 Tax=Cacopsylla melanoneura TaxID=428564 RepID=A0A8D8XW55_9HEMI